MVAPAAGDKNILPTAYRLLPTPLYNPIFFRSHRMTEEQLPFIEANDQTRARREHLGAIRQLVGNAYPNKFARSRLTGAEDTLTAVVKDERIKALVPQVAQGARPTADQ